MLRGWSHVVLSRRACHKIIVKQLEECCFFCWQIDMKRTDIGLVSCGLEYELIHRIDKESHRKRRAKKKHRKTYQEKYHHPYTAVKRYTDRKK